MDMKDEKFDHIINNVKTSMAVENHKLTDSDVAFIKEYDDGKYTMEQAIQAVIDNAILKGESNV